MSAIAFLRQLLDDGLDLAAALTAADRFEQRAIAAETARILERREKDAERKRAQRERECHAESRGQAVTSEDSRGPSPHIGEPAQVVTPSLSSLPSEVQKELETPISPDGEMPPQVTKLSFAKPNGFARFWEIYPNKTGKGAAEKAFAKALKLVSGPDPPGQLIAAVERAKQGRQWSEGFVPNPLTWLNQRRWEDEIEAPRKAHDRPHHDPKQAAREDRLGRMLSGAMAAVDGPARPGVRASDDGACALPPLRIVGSS